jgi:LytS/YehU family sensor histidine kinase
VRFPKRLKVEIDVPADLENARLPALILQPVVENAIKYAVSPQEEGAQISLTAQLIAKRLRVTVSDTGPGLQGRRLTQSESSTGLGLANIRNRLAQAYGEDHRFDVETPPEGGFTVIIEVPYEPATAADGHAVQPSAARTPSLESFPANRAIGIPA